MGGTTTDQTSIKINDPGIKAKKTVVQIRQTTAGLMESTNQFLLSFDRDKYHLVVIYLKGSLSEEKRCRVVADEVLFMHLADSALMGLKVSAVHKLIKMLRFYQPTVLFAHRYHSVWLAGMACRFVKVSTCFAVLHGNTQINRFGRRLFTQLFLSGRFFFVGISNAVREDLLASGAGLEPEQVISMPNSIDIATQKKALLSRRKAREFLGLPDDGHYIIGHVARLSPKKNQRHLLSSFAEVVAMVPNALLVLVGDGKLEGELKSLAADLNIEHAVRFTGRVDKASIYMKAFDLFVMTSKDEGFGRVLLEAMTARCPIIATDIPAFSEVLCGSGTLVPINDIARLSKVIQNYVIMESRELENILRDQDRVLNDKYGLETFKNRFKEIYSSISKDRLLNPVSD